MDYRRIYQELVQRRREASPEGYSEVHHIVPRSLGGSDDPSNLVRLSGREHFIAHLLLHKIHRNDKTAYALWMMMNCRNTKVSSRIYEITRKNVSQIERLRQRLPHSLETRSKISISQKGKTLSLSHRQKISSARKGVKLKTKRAPISEETRKKLSLAKIGKIRSDSHKRSLSKALKEAYSNPLLKEKISVSMRGKQKSLEHREKISISCRCRLMARRALGKGET